jgi:hypothetical protein
MKLVNNKSLDIMIYDSSDWAGEELRLSWIAGGKFYKLFRSVEHHAGFSSWEEAIKWILEVEPDKKINSIQFWGHGSPGRVWINEETLSARSVLATSNHRDLLLKLKKRLTSNSVVWFRSCNVFMGQEGHLFAKVISKMLGCTIASHTYIVGPWQSGLHTIRPDEEPKWDLEEGIEQSGKKLWSMPWSPNTIFCLTGKIPKGW